MSRLLERVVGLWRRADWPSIRRNDSKVFPAISSFAGISRVAAAGVAGVSAVRGMPRRWWALLLTAPALAAIGHVALSPPVGVGAARPLQSVLAMLNLRSPGARAEGDLLASKPALAAVPSQRALGKVFGPPQQRALGKIFAPPAGVALPGDGAFIPPFQPGTLNFVGPPIPAGEGPGGPLFGGGGGVPGGGGGGGSGGPGLGVGGSGGPGGGGGIDGGDAGFDDEPGTGTFPGTPPVPAVPEPGTWLLMIVAFGFCGSMLRRQRRPSLGRPPCDFAPSR